VLSTSICCVHCYQAVCAAVAVTMQYLFLSSFFLMLVQAAALLVKLKAVLQARSRLATYCILGWGEPCLNWLGAVMLTRTFHQGPGPGPGLSCVPRTRTRTKTTTLAGSDRPLDPGLRAPEPLMRARGGILDGAGTISS